MSVLAALALGDLPGIEGEVRVIGTPAEESGGSKVILAESGFMDDVDLAAMIHCGNATAVPFRSLAIDAQRFTFEGGEASDALMFFLHCLDMIRDDLPEGVSIHGIVRHDKGRGSTCISAPPKGTSLRGSPEGSKDVPRVPRKRQAPFWGMTVLNPPLRTCFRTIRRKISWKDSSCWREKDLPLKWVTGEAATSATSPTGARPSTLSCPLRKSR